MQIIAHYQAKKKDTHTRKFIWPVDKFQNSYLTIVCFIWKKNACLNILLTEDVTGIHYIFNANFNNYPKKELD
jgi:hypothetical protein